MAIERKPIRRGGIKSAGYDRGARVLEIEFDDGSVIQHTAVGEEIKAGRLRNRGGEPVSKPITEGLVREDGKILYPVDDGIPVMLIEESIELS